MIFFELLGSSDGDWLKLFTWPFQHVLAKLTQSTAITITEYNIMVCCVFHCFVGVVIIPLNRYRDPSTVQLLASPHINLKVKRYGMGDLKLMRHFLVFNIIDEHATRHCFSFPGAQVHGWFHTENTDIVVMKTSHIPFLPWRCQCFVEPKYKHFGVEQKFICNDWNWHTGAKVYRHPPLPLCPRMMLKES